MLMTGRGLKPDQLRMNLRELIPVDMTASAVAHVSVLALVLLLSEVHPFDVVAADTVPVDIVTPQDIEKKDIEKKPEPTPSPSPSPVTIHRSVCAPRAACKHAASTGAAARSAAAGSVAAAPPEPAGTGGIRFGPAASRGNTGGRPSLHAAGA